MSVEKTNLEMKFTKFGLNVRSHILCMEHDISLSWRMLFAVPSF